MTVYSRFGTLLKRYRQEAGLSQEALAARADLSARAISDLERGVNHSPRSDTLELLMSALSLPEPQQVLLRAAAHPVGVSAPEVAQHPSSFHSLPLALPLVGRAEERSHALALLRGADVRLLTLTGPSGVGKTRLGLQIAHDLADDFSDGVAYVPLAPVHDATLVPAVIGQCLHLSEQVERSMEEQVRSFLQPRQFLLVLDNFEHLLEAAPFVADLLANCPRLQVLVTSRAPLRLRAENVFPLAPLPLDDAITLFRNRAQAVRPGGAYEGTTVAAICKQVDCLPLAIELAAMQVRLLSLTELLERLSTRLALLSEGARDLPARQRTMRNAIAWSYSLLTETQQRFFRVLGVFVGGWTLEAAEAVGSAMGETTSDETLLMLAALVDASLVQVEMPTESASRFSMLELVREYALDALRTAGEEEVCRRRHAAYYARLGESVTPFGSGQGVGETQLALDFPNARVALQWAEEQQEATLGLQLVGAFGLMWFSYGYLREAEMWLERMLALDWQAGEPEAVLVLRATTLYILGDVLLGLGKLERAEALATEFLERARLREDQIGMSSAWVVLGMVARARGKLDEAATFFAESDTHARLTEHLSIKGIALRNRAELAWIQGDLAQATTFAEEGRLLAQSAGITFVVAGQTTILGHLARQQGKYALAKTRYREALALYRTFGNPTYSAWCLEGLAATLCAEGRFATATRLCAAVAAQREQAQTPLLPAEREAFEQTVASAQAALDKATFEAEWATGSAFTPEEAIDHALRNGGAYETSKRSTSKHNLPAPVSSFIGREQELREIQKLLGEHRLITLTGTGGTGKTRLALQAATAEIDHFSDGVWLIDLAPLVASELVLETIAKVLTLPEVPGPSPIERLGAYLEVRHVLLVLDNCEQVIEECARIVTSLLARCPHLTLLATSREPLRVNGEVVLRVPALSLPAEAELVDRTRLLAYDALRLFVERAQAADSSFRVMDGNAGVVAEICRHLDGLPLALELAAVRVRGLGVARLSAGLDQRFQLLTGGDRTALPRQQTLHAMIDWSYRLLPEPEQVLLRRLGIFVGAFSLQAVESICAKAQSGQNGLESIPPETILQSLLQLVNKSLVQFNQESGRYRLLETIRIFALEQLTEVGETPSLHRQHFAWYLQLAEHAAPNLSGPLQEAWFARLEAEHDNLRVALGWAIDTGRTEEAARLALALWRFWHTRTYQREGVRWLERILALDVATPLSPALRPQLFNALGVLSLYQFDRAMSYHTEALRLWRALDDRAGMAQALFDIGWQQFDEMKLDQARKSARESLALARMVESPPAIARALLLDGLAATESDLVEEAIPVLEESLALFREIGDSGNMASAMAILARAEGKRGNDERAKPLLRDAVGLLVQQGNFISLIGPLVALGFMALHSEVQPEGACAAAQIFGMMATWGEKLGGTNLWSEEPMRRVIEQVTAILGADAFAQAFEIGKQMTPADLVQLAEQITTPTTHTILLPTPPRPAPLHSHLSPREMDVLRLLAQGLTSAQIAEQLVIGVVTVNFHVRSIYSKLGVSSRSAATRYALEHHLE